MTTMVEIRIVRAPPPIINHNHQYRPNHFGVVSGDILFTVKTVWKQPKKKTKKNPRRMKDEEERWRMKDEGWRWRMKDEDEGWRWKMNDFGE
jgi:hypothetical protein